ncbi:hypothetical protein PORY_001523 [Pneumocystis oryctolagi]|uniref:Uncharacterized protein n=1 Tax=Pneumocystis oryctolagi TaxID=42067 RepID=A0ACB7CCQ0_9ASCO|nr:hypothetical protein PORY_001523 [Pneumocystis oryctolagi]
MKIALVHPDLGIGGAERFTVDAAVGLQVLGHDVVIYTSYCNFNHCFEEVKNGVLRVKIYGSKIPGKIFGKFSILCAIFRQLYLSLRLLLEKDAYDVIIVDLLSFSIPLLRTKCSKLLFYCHFPDKFLAKHDSFLRRVYRFPFDWIEEWTLLMADKILTNSHFTASIIRKAFPNIEDLTVLYPSINIHREEVHSNDQLLICKSYFHLILSINRFERKKDISLAIKSYFRLKEEKYFCQCCLVIAGGYESRVEENVQYHSELVDLCNRLKLKTKTFSHPYIYPLDFSGYNVVFLLSIPTSLKEYLLQNATILLYTPPYEHFGIVPLEAMFYKTIVLAQNNGGPLETIDDGITGWLRKSDDTEWACVLKNTLFELTEKERIIMGEKGRQKTYKCEISPVHQDEHPLSSVFSEGLDSTRNLKKSNNLNGKGVEENNSSRPLFSRLRAPMPFFSGKNVPKTMNKVLSSDIPNHTLRVPLFDEYYDQALGNIYFVDDSYVQRLIDRYGAINFIRHLVQNLALRDVQVIENQKQSRDREIVLKKMLLSAGVSYLDIEKYLRESSEKLHESLLTDTLNHTVFGESYIESLDEQLAKAMEDNNVDKYLKKNFDIDGKVSDYDSNTTRYSSLQKNIDVSNKKEKDSSFSNSFGEETLKTINGENHTNVLFATDQKFSFKDLVLNSKTSHIQSKLQSYSRSFNKILPKMTSFDSFTSSEIFSKMSGLKFYFKENVSDLQYFHTTHFKAISLAACYMLFPGEVDKKIIYLKKKSSMIVDFSWRLILPIAFDYHQTLIQDFLSKSKVSDLNLDKILLKYLKELPSDNIGFKTSSINRLYEEVIKIKLKHGYLYKNILLNNSIIPDIYSQDQNGSASLQTGVGFSPVIKETASAVLTSGSHSFSPFYSVPRSLEMDTIVPPERQPPTLLSSWSEHYGADEKPLADRFGFIYSFRFKNKISGPKLAEVPEDVNKTDGNHSEDLKYSNDMDRVKKKVETEKREGINVFYLKKGLIISRSSFQKFIDIGNKLLSYNGVPPITLTSLSSDNSVAQGFITVNMNEKSKAFAAKILLRSQLDTYNDDKTKQELWDVFLRKIQNEKKRNMNSNFYNCEGSELIGVSGLGVEGKVGKQRWKEFRNLVIGGVPIIYRPKVWKECSGAYQLQQPGYYNDLLAAGKDVDPMVVAQIDMDIYRTMPNNVFFGGKGPGVLKLRNVLLAFSRHNTQIGYCQGMNVIAATLLLIHATEEDAFYVLVSIVENILPPNYFTPGLLASRADQRVLIRYVSELCPRIYDHLKKLSVDLEAVTFNWFLSVFTDCLPADVLFRVFDLLFIEGSVYLFRVSIVIIKSKEKQILACTSPASVYSLLKNLSIELFNIDSFIRATCENRKRIRIKDVIRYRELEIRKLKTEMEITALQEVEFSGST